MFSQTGRHTIAALVLLIICVGASTAPSLSLSSPESRRRCIRHVPSGAHKATHGTCAQLASAASRNLGRVAVSALKADAWTEEEEEEEGSR